MPEVKVVDTLTARTGALEAVEVDDPLEVPPLLPAEVKDVEAKPDRTLIATRTVLARRRGDAEA